jgi:magnesium transporter
MLVAFAVEQGPVRAIAEGDSLEPAVWIDLIDATDEELARLHAFVPLAFANDEDTDEIDSSARSYIDGAGAHISTLFLHRSEGRPENTNVNFILGPDRLVTVHDRDVPALRLLRRQVRREGTLLADPRELLVRLFEIAVDDLGDTLQEVYIALDKAGRIVLEDTDDDVESALDNLARQQDLNGKVQLCLMDTRRDLSYIERHADLSDGHVRRVRNLVDDVDALLPHNAFLFEKVNFLMQAAQGFIDIEQNRIIKIFSVAAVTFLPPTLIASIYGMNFERMPELEWWFGYPMSVALMIVSAVLPYVYFKRRGWL